LYLTTPEPRPLVAIDRQSESIGERDLLIGRGQHLFLVGFELLHFARQLGELLFQICGLRSERLRRLLQVGSVQLRQITRDALLQLLPA
jgi:hypothetical protein